MPKKPAWVNRRSFLATSALGAALGGFWLAKSRSWKARFLREYIAEIGREIPAAANKPTPATWDDNAITLAWLGHSTVLINFYGVRILTDPVFSPRVGIDLLVGTLGPQRQVAPALNALEIPEVDLVLVSHAHFDHLDIPSLNAVRGKPAAIMAKNTSDLLPAKKYSSVQELKWDEAATVKTSRGNVTVRGLEVKHWGARVRTDTHRGYNGYVIEREGKKLLFGGDTADTTLFAEHRRHGPFAAAIMPVGAYDPWIHAHCTPEQAVAMADAAGAVGFVPVHHQTFKLSNEARLAPLERTQAAFAKEPERLLVKNPGDTAVIKA